MTNNNIINPFEEMATMDKNRKRRVAIYGRVSTEHEEQIDALKNQLQWYDDQLDAHPNWVLHKKYIDKGITGTQAKKRPAFLEMIKDAEKGKFDLIVTREVSRFARNTVETLQFTRNLKYEYNVEVYFIEDNIWTMDGDGELRLTIMATLAQEESRKTSERVKAGQKISRDNGVIYGNGNILGYDKVGDKYVVNEEQAATIRKIFGLYIEGYTMSQIKNILEKDGDYTSGGGKWSTTLISRILNRTTYCGVMAYGQSYNNGYLDQKRFSNNNRKSYMYKETEKIPPIVSKEDFKKVQKIIESRRTYDPATCKERSKKEKRNVWTLKVKCGCGSSVRMEHFTRHTNGLCYCFRCYNQVNNGSINVRLKKGLSIENACGIKSAVDWKLEIATYNTLKHVWGDMNKVIKNTFSIIEDSYTEESIIQNNAKEKLEQKLNKLIQKKDRLLEMRADGEITKEEYLKLKEKTETDIYNITKEIEKNSSSPSYDKENVLKNIKENLNKYIDLDNNKIREDIIREFIYRIYNMGDDKYIIIVNLGIKEDELKNETVFNDNLAYYVSSINGNWKNHEVEIKEHDEIKNDGDMPLNQQQLHRLQLLKAGLNNNRFFIDSIYIDYKKALDYMNKFKNSQQIRKNRWNDMKIEIIVL